MPFDSKIGTRKMYAILGCVIIKIPHTGGKESLDRCG